MTSADVIEREVEERVQLHLGRYDGDWRIQGALLSEYIRRAIVETIALEPLIPRSRANSARTFLIESLEAAARSVRAMPPPIS